MNIRTNSTKIEFVRIFCIIHLVSPTVDWNARDYILSPLEGALKLLPLFNSLKNHSCPVKLFTLSCKKSMSF